MRPLAYRRASDAETAVALTAQTPGAQYLGGGTNLVDLMKLGVANPDLLVDVTRAGLNDVEFRPENGLVVGAGVRNADLAAEPVVRERYPVLSQALLAGASGQLRNMATVGGNLMQRTRCRYFQDIAAACNKRAPGSGCPAREGEHHNLAILGASEDCVATHPSDMAVALSALEARISLTGPGGTRHLDIDDFYRLPGDQPDRDTNIEPGELITAVTLPPPSRGATRSAYRKVRERASYAFALASVAAMLEVGAEGRITRIRLSLGAVAHRPWRAKVAERVLLGRSPEPGLFRSAIDAELAQAAPLRDNGFKVVLVRRLVVATLTELAGRADGGSQGGGPA